MHHNQGMGYPTFLIQAPLGHYLAEMFVLVGAGYSGRQVRVDGRDSWPAAGGCIRRPPFARPSPSGSDTQAAGEVEERSGLMAASWPPWPQARSCRTFPITLPASRAWGVERHPAAGVAPGSSWRSTGPGWAGQGGRGGLAMLILAGTLLTHTFALLSIAPFLVFFVLFRLVQAWVRERPAVAADAPGRGWRPRRPAVDRHLPAAAAGGGALSATAGLRGQHLRLPQPLGSCSSSALSGDLATPDDPGGRQRHHGLSVGGASVCILALVALFTVRRAYRDRGLLLFLLVGGAAAFYPP